jgi:polyisoprenoid-binding protein YceI
MTAFSFEKALMEEHFNENYVESHKFPKATFKGQILDISKIDFNKDGTYIVKIKGMLNVHGVDKEVVTDAKVVVTGKNLKVTASFTVTPSDFKVEIPSLVKDKIAKEIKVTVDAPYTKM